jgi:hypothetical protein
MKIYKIEEILNKLEKCIKYKLPFSHIRFGDGGIKYIHSILYNEKHQLSVIIKKEGIPRSKLLEVFELWGYYARQADFIDTPEVYFMDTFWPRVKKPGKPISEATYKKLSMWRDLYSRAEFDNENYCNPESNYLMITKIKQNKTLLDVMKKRKIAIITARPEVKSKLNEFDTTVIKIVGHYENQYKNSFKQLVSIIEHTAKDYDFWLVAAGELGRIYTGLIKEHGGRAVDIGFVAEYWLGEGIHTRFMSYLRPNWDNALELYLTYVGKKYEDYI